MALEREFVSEQYYFDGVLEGLGNSIADNVDIRTLGTQEVHVLIDSISVEGYVFSGIDLTVDITVSGAGGLDTGSEAAQSWYSVWLVTDGHGSLQGLLSLSAISPSLPPGTVAKRRVGWVYNDSLSNFFPFVKRGGEVIYPYLAKIDTNSTTADGYGHKTAYYNPAATVDLRSVFADTTGGVPPGTRVAYFTFWTYSHGWVYGDNSYIYIRPNVASSFTEILRIVTTGVHSDGRMANGNGNGTQLFVKFPIDSASTTVNIHGYSGDGGSAIRWGVHGYVDPD